MRIHDWTRVTAGTFHDFHLAWIAELRRALNGGLLPNEYYALAEQVAGETVPDVLTLQQRGGDAVDESDDGAGGGLGVMTAPPRVAQVATLDEAAAISLRQRRLTIRHRSGDRVVALLEIVSPGNKDRVSSVEAFTRKAEQALRAGLHLLIIDLFPPGPHDPSGMHGAIWDRLHGDFAFDPAKPLTLAAYRAEFPYTAYIEPTAVGATLIEMPLFLTAERYINAPLDATYAAAWEGVPRRWREVIEA